jgi:uncharacterized protein
VIHLADVNVLVALTWEQHIHHGPAVGWYTTLAGTGWASCTATQTGFVRVSANPVAVGQVVSVRHAVAVLAALVAQPSHHFLADDRGFVDNPLVPHDRLVGHRQVTDAHLIAIARAHSALVATFDQAMTALGGPDVHVIPT